LQTPPILFYEAIEKKWVEHWLFYASSIRYAAAMAGPDYASFKNGWWELTRNLQEIKGFVDSGSQKGERKREGD